MLCSCNRCWVLYDGELVALSKYPDKLAHQAMVEHIVKCYKSGTPFCLPLVLDLLGVLLGVDGTLLQDLVIVDKAKCDTKRIKDVE